MEIVVFIEHYEEKQNIDKIESTSAMALIAFAYVVTIQK